MHYFGRASIHSLAMPGGADKPTFHAATRASRFRLLLILIRMRTQEKVDSGANCGSQPARRCGQRGLHAEHGRRILPRMEHGPRRAGERDMAGLAEEMGQAARAKDTLTETTEPLRLEKTSKIIKSNRHPNTTMRGPEVPPLHGFEPLQGW